MQKFKKNQLVTNGPEGASGKVLKIKGVYTSEYGTTIEFYGHDGQHNTSDYRPLTQDEKRRYNNDCRKAKDEALRSLGLTKVKGALGGTYWE